MGAQPAAVGPSIWNGVWGWVGLSVEAMGLGGGGRQGQALGMGDAGDTQPVTLLSAG